ncbi:MAG: acetyl-CoA carboxylase, carboxyltransferase subunit beta [Planctomycetes bacterium]|nr:acetyl-CoA carboxylase, carboxyltransferase subunit beta [Planctomycetota bacterium]
MPRRTQPGPGEDGPGTKCENCQELLIKKTLNENLGICPLCNHHHRITARRRMEITLDEGTFEERYYNLISKDPLNFHAVKSYRDKLNQYWHATGEPSSMLCGTGELLGRPVALAISDGFFTQGSMGSVLGEKLTRIVEDCIKEKLPLITVSGSGAGARMEEGLFSLMQMAKTSAALGKLHDAGLPFISLCTRFTMAGVWASWAALGDIIIAEPKALIGFTGARVIKETIKKELPDDFQTAEFLLNCGQIDMIIDRKDMRKTLAQTLDYLCVSAASPSLQAQSNG